MPHPKLSRVELRIMEALWSQGALSVREILESLPARRRPAYTTVQTTVYRLEAKKVLRRKKKVGSALIFEAVISRDTAQTRLVDELLDLFGGDTQPLMSHLVRTGRLTLADVEDARQLLRDAEAQPAVDAPRDDPKS